MLLLLCWEESQRDSVPGEHQSSTRHEEGKKKQVQGLELSGGLGNGSEEGQDSREEWRLGERQAPAEGGFSLFPKRYSQLLQRAVERLCPEEAQLSRLCVLHLSFCVASISKTKQCGRCV